MEDVWDNSSRFNCINEAIGRLPHDQIPIGIGFRLRHDPTKCIRCKAFISALELGTIVRLLETATEMVDEEEVTIDS